MLKANQIKTEFAVQQYSCKKQPPALITANSVCISITVSKAKGNSKSQIKCSLRVAVILDPIKKQRSSDASRQKATHILALLLKKE